MISIRKRIPLLPHNRSRPSKLPYLKLNYCCVVTFFAWLYNWFNSKWLLNNLNGLSWSKSTWSLISKISKSGSFLHFLATFGIENGFMITLAIFGDLKFAKNMCHIIIHIIKLKKSWTHRVIFHILKIC